MSADLAEFAAPEFAAPGTDPSPDPDSSTAAGQVTVTTDPLEAWTTVLDSLEVAIDDAVAGDLDADDLYGADIVPETAVLGGWTPPADLGPIPAELMERALRINGRQQDAAAQLTGELRTLRRHRSVLGSVQTAIAPEEKSVYLDVTG